VTVPGSFLFLFFPRVLHEEAESGADARAFPSDPMDMLRRVDRFFFFSRSKD